MSNEIMTEAELMELLENDSYKAPERDPKNTPINMEIDCTKIKG